MPRIAVRAPLVLAFALAAQPALAVDDGPPVDAEVVARVAAGVPGDDPAILASVDPRLGREPPPPEVAEPPEPQQALVWERRPALPDAAPPQPADEGGAQR